MADQHFVLRYRKGADPVEERYASRLGAIGRAVNLICDGGHADLFIHDQEGNEVMSHGALTGLARTHC